MKERYRVGSASKNCMGIKHSLKGTWKEEERKKKRMRKRTHEKRELIRKSDLNTISYLHYLFTSLPAKGSIKHMLTH